MPPGSGKWSNKTTELIGTGGILLATSLGGLSCRQPPRVWNPRAGRTTVTEWAASRHKRFSGPAVAGCVPVRLRGRDENQMGD